MADADAAFTVAPRRMVHVVVMDGTLSSLEEGFETIAGLAYRLLKRKAEPGVTLHYQPGYNLIGVIFWHPPGRC